MTSSFIPTSKMNTQLSFSKPPPRFVCPFTKMVMKDPVTSLTTGLSYERSAIVAWQSKRGNVCPITGQMLGFLVANETLKSEIGDWKQQVKGYRRIQRGSPTTYFLAASPKNAPQGNATDARQTKTKKVETEELTKARDEMFDMVDKMMQTFTDAGLSDYINRVMDDEAKDPSKTCTPTSSLPDLNALIEDATTSGYQYNVEYNSIFRQHSSTGSSRSI